MADRNDAVFRLAEKVIINAVSDEGSRQTNHHALGMQKFVKTYNDQLYTEMARTGVLLADSTPRILLDGNPYGKPWAPLSTGYQDRKASQGYDTPGFYRRKGELAQDLYARSSSRDFGRAEVTVETKGAGINSSKYKIDSSGRPRFLKGAKDLAGRGIGGRFAPMSAFRSLVFRIEMQLFTKLTDNITPGMMKNLYPSAIGKKLGPGEFGRSSGKGRNQPARPLLRPFLYWYATTNFRNRFYENFKIKV
jgi:hypothetical protein